MGRKASVERERYWRELLERQARSGWSVRRFCGVEGVSEPSFYCWRKRLRSWKQARVKAGGASAPAPQRPSEPLFVPLGTLGGTEAVLEIVHPSGCRVRVVGPLNVSSLKQVLQTLDERGTQ